MYAPFSSHGSTVFASKTFTPWPSRNPISSPVIIQIQVVTPPLTTVNPTQSPVQIYQEREHDNKITWISENEVRCGIGSRSNKESLSVTYYYQVETENNSNDFMSGLEKALLRDVAPELLVCGVAEQVRALASGRIVETGLITVDLLPDDKTSTVCKLFSYNNLSNSSFGIFLK